MHALGRAHPLHQIYKPSLMVLSRLWLISGVLQSTKFKIFRNSFTFFQPRWFRNLFYPYDIANIMSQERNYSQALLWRRLYECFLLKSLWRQACAQEIMGSLNSTNNEPFLPSPSVLAWISRVSCHIVLPEHHLKSWIASD